MASITSACIASTLLVASARAGFPINSPPRFDSFSATRVFVDLRLGQRSFEITGVASDPDADQTLSFFLSASPSFFKLDFVPSNPATFRIHAENLTYAQYGGYLFDIGVRDSSPEQATAAYPLGVSIIPEPTCLVSLSAGIWTIGMRRRPRR